MKVLFKDLDQRMLKHLMALTKDYGTSRLVLADEEDPHVDWVGVFRDLCSLLDAVLLP